MIVVPRQLLGVAAAVEGDIRPRHPPIRRGLWMEYIDGRTLHDLVASDGRRFSPPDVREARTIADLFGPVDDVGMPYPAAGPPR